MDFGSKPELFQCSLVWIEALQVVHFSRDLCYSERAKYDSEDPKIPLTEDWLHFPWYVDVEIGTSSKKAVYEKS